MGAFRLPPAPEPENERPLRLLAWIFGSLVAAVLVFAAVDYRLIMVFLGRLKAVPAAGSSDDSGNVDSSPVAVEGARKLGVSRIPTGYVIGYVGDWRRGSWVRLISKLGTSPDQILLQRYDGGSPAEWDLTARTFEGCDNTMGSANPPNELWVALRAGVHVFGVRRLDCRDRLHRMEYIDLSRTWHRGALYAEGRSYGWDDRPIVQVLEGLRT
jgi:hypothetical protein